MTSPSSASVGNVHADIVPDVTGFKDALKRKIEALNLAPAKVEATPDVKGFARDLKTKLDALTNLPKVKVEATPNLRGFNAALRASLAALPNLEVRVKATPSLTGFNATLRRDLGALPSVNANVVVDVDTRRAATRLAAFRTTASRPIDIPIDVSTRAGSASLANLRRTLRGSISIPVDLDTRAAAASYVALRALVGRPIDIHVDLDTGAAAASMAAFIAAYRSAIAGLPPIRPGGAGGAGRAGAVDGGAYARTFRAATDEALRNLGPYRITLNRDPAIAGITQIRRDLDTLNNQRIGIDIDAAQALAEVERIQIRLRELSAQSPNIQVRADTAAAALRLELLRRQLESLGRERVNIGADAGPLRFLSSLLSSVGGGFGIAAIAAAEFGSIVVPVIASATGAVISLVGSLASLTTGIGVGILALSGVLGAVQALNKASDEQAKTQATLAKQDNQLASGADAVRSAVASLANTRAQAASAARQSANSIADAERSLADAQRDALRAQQDITRAREEAKDALEDLDSAVKNNSLSIRQANLDLADAKANLDKVLADPAATKRQREEAQLTYDRAAQQIDDLTVRQGRLKEEQAAASKAGVEGSQQVVAAQEKYQDAQRRVQDAERAVTEARVQAADQARQSAFAIAQAQQGVVNAQRSAANSVAAAAKTAGGALDDVKDKLGNLSVAGQGFARFISGLRQPLLDLRRESESGFLPGLQLGIDSLLRRLPDIQIFVGKVANVLGDIAEKALTALSGDRFQTFFSYIDDTAVGTLGSFAEAIGNVIETVGNLVAAFSPFQRDMEGGLVSLTARWAEWSRGLETNAGFQNFLAYVREEGPRVVEMIGNLVELVIDLGIALAPTGSALLRFINYTEPLLKLSGVIVNILSSGPLLAALTGQTGDLSKGIVQLDTPMANLARNVRTAKEVFGDATTSVDSYRTVLDALGVAQTTNGRTFDALAGVFSNIENSALGATDKVKLLRQAMEQLYGGMRTAIDADDALARAKANLSTQLTTNAYGFDLNSKAAQGHTTEVLNNREALKTALKALQDSYLANIANGDSVDVARQKYEDQKAALLKGIPVTKDQSDAVGVLVTAYGSLPPKKTTQVETPGLGDAIRAMIKAQAIQQGLAAKPPWSMTEIENQARLLEGHIFGGQVSGAGGIAVMKATGGLIPGHSPHDRADNIPAWLTADEFVQPVRAVKHYGVDFMESIRTLQFPREMKARRGYASGGFVSGNLLTKIPISIPPPAPYISVEDSWRQWEDARRAAVSYFGPGPGFPPWPSSPSASRGDSGVWRSIVALIRSTGPASGSFGNAYRPGDPLWHGCVPMDTEVLTRRGWLRYEQVQVGHDETVGYNPLTGRNEWTPIVGMHHYHNADLWTISDGDWTADVTPGHRWLTTEGMVETRDLRADHMVQVAARLADNIDPALGLVDERQVVAGLRQVGIRQADVYCPTTGLGTWTARQHGQIFLTGNSGRAVDWMGYQQDALARFLADRNPLELIHRTGQRDYAYTRGRNRGSFNNALMEQHRNHVHIAMADGGLIQVPRISYDGGGPLAPGLTLADNRTGGYEYINTADDQKALLAAAARGSRGSGEFVHIDQFNAYANQSVHEVARDLDWQIRHRG